MYRTRTRCDVFHRIRFGYLIFEEYTYATHSVTSALYIIMCMCILVYFYTGQIAFAVLSNKKENKLDYEILYDVRVCVHSKEVHTQVSIWS